MDLLWTPWRYRYVTNAEKAVRPGVPRSLEDWPGDLGCVFCNLIAAVDHAIANGKDRDQAEMAAGLILRGKDCFICLNAYPYTSGHVMVIPHKHEASLAALPVKTAHELMDLAQKTERGLASLYSPHGMNFGLNLGQAAGAGVAAGDALTPRRRSLWAYMVEPYIADRSRIDHPPIVIARVILYHPLCTRLAVVASESEPQLLASLAPRCFDQTV